MTVKNRKSSGELDHRKEKSAGTPYWVAGSYSDANGCPASHALIIYIYINVPITV
jgi:hypothetical protein